MILHLSGIRLHHPPLWRRIERGMELSAVVAACAVLVAVMMLSGCAPAAAPLPPQAQQVVDVLCRGDALAQPVVVPVVMVAAPLAGPAAPAVAAGMALDQVLVHPLVVRACADHASKPAEIVALPPPGVPVAAPVTVPAVVIKPGV